VPEHVGESAKPFDPEAFRQLIGFVFLWHSTSPHVGPSCLRVSIHCDQVTAQASASTKSVEHAKGEGMLRAH
jgi:hypothetical protein